MANKVTRLKAAARQPAPQSRDEAAAHIRRIGDLSREQLRAQAELNDAIAQLTERYQPRLDALTEEIKGLQAGVQTWCEANRADLTGGKTKTANLITGEVQWRSRPPSCRITGAESVIDTLERLGLGRFVRIKKEVNKDAILNEPQAVEGVAGISIQSGVEDFVILPFEIEAQSA